MELGITCWLWDSQISRYTEDSVRQSLTLPHPLLGHHQKSSLGSASFDISFFSGEGLRGEKKTREDKRGAFPGGLRGLGVWGWDSNCWKHVQLGLVSCKYQDTATNMMNRGCSFPPQHLPCTPQSRFFSHVQAFGFRVSEDCVTRWMSSSFGVRHRYFSSLWYFCGGGSGQVTSAESQW